MKNILIVDDSKIARYGLKKKLEEMEDVRVAGELENAANAEIVCTRGGIDLILMDVCTADGESGLDAAKIIKAQYPNIKIIIITSMPEYSFIEKARAAGCESFFYKEEESDLIDVIRRTLAGESIYPEASPRIMIGDASSDEFTEREMEVIEQLAEGRKYDEIAGNLGISANTVKYHIKNILSKTGYSTTLKLIVDVVEKKLVLPKF